MILRLLMRGKSNTYHLLSSYMTPCFQGPGVCPASSGWFYVAEKTKINSGFGGCLTVALWGCSRRKDGRLYNWNSASHLLHDCLAALSGHVKLTEAVQQAGSCLFICPAWNGTHHKNVKKSHLHRLCIDIWSILKTLSDIPLPLKSVW